MQIPRFTASKPSEFAFASDEKSIRQPTTSFVRCYLKEAIGQGSPVQAAFCGTCCPHAICIVKTSAKTAHGEGVLSAGETDAHCNRKLSRRGSPEGAVAQTWTFDSPLWAFFGYFLSQQKVTESLPQKRLKPRKKSSLLLKSRKTHSQFHPIFRQQPTKKTSAACICRASVL